MNRDANDVIIYGGGGFHSRFAGSLRDAGVRVVLVIDQYTEMKEVGGVPIVRLDDARIDRSLPVHVCVAASSDRIARQLRELGHEHVYDFAQSVRRFPGMLDAFLPSMPWYGCGEGLVDEAAMAALEDRLEDERSKEVLHAVRDFRRHLDADHYLESDGQLQYFPDDVPLFEGVEELRFVDCGAFTGDTLDVLMAYGESHRLPVRSVCLFEPERRNFAALNERVAAHASADRHIVTIPCGAWSESLVLKIASDGASSSVVTAEDDAHGADPSSLQDVSVVRLDHAVRGMRPNYIKMDIEGAERAALRGAADVLLSYRPALAVCLYHAADDLWQIPRLVDELCPGYAFYLRSHSDLGLETVLYALPCR